jgi:hypothetical protein
MSERNLALVFELVLLAAGLSLVVGGSTTAAIVLGQVLLVVASLLIGINALDRWRDA